MNVHCTYVAFIWERKNKIERRIIYLLNEIVFKFSHRGRDNRYQKMMWEFLKVIGRGKKTTRKVILGQKIWSSQGKFLRRIGESSPGKDSCNPRLKWKLTLRMEPIYFLTETKFDWKTVSEDLPNPSYWYRRSIAEMYEEESILAFVFCIQKLIEVR